MSCLILIRLRSGCSSFKSDYTTLQMLNRVTRTIQHVDKALKCLIFINAVCFGYSSQFFVEGQPKLDRRQICFRVDPLSKFAEAFRQSMNVEVSSVFQSSHLTFRGSVPDIK